jgi:hypothetical protein
MPFHEKSRAVLIEKLGFTAEQVTQLEGSAELRKQTLNLIDMVRRSPKQPDIQRFVRVRLNDIRRSLGSGGFEQSRFLQKARSEYYTFQRAYR